MGPVRYGLAMSETPPRGPRRASATAGDWQGAAVAAGPLADVRVPLPGCRRHGDSVPYGRVVLGVAAGVALVFVALAFTVPQAAALAWCAVLGVGGLAAVFLMTSEPLRERPSSFALLAGSLGGAALVAAWLGNDSVAARVLLFPLWLPIGLLLRRGASATAGRTLLSASTVVLLGAVLLWANLLLTVALQPTNTAQCDVFAGWPWPHYLGAVRGNAPPGAPVRFALWLDYAVMLGIAAVVVWRRPSASLAAWLPRLCGLLAAAHLVGGYRLAFATDG